MTKLTEQELHFARRHLERFEDSDFFPSTVAYNAMWNDWENVRDRMMAANIRKIPIAPAISLPVAKGKSTYRIVHQLEPLTSLIYTALSYRIGPIIESARPAVSEGVACSHRFQPDDGAFFTEGSGYDVYRDRSFELSNIYGYAATADISDFYNQIYSHRVRASIEAADRSFEETAQDFESVIHSINAGASKGIPVGPVPSGLVAEAIMLDVDQLLIRNGFVHTRYVDDIRIFSDNVGDLQSAIEVLSEYLYDNHRLHLNSSKTNIYSIDDFVKDVLVDHVDDETEAAIRRLSLIDPYNEQGELGPEDVPDEDVIDEIGSIINQRFSEGRFVDQNLIKSYIRRVRLTDSLLFLDVAGSSLDAFTPVFHELAKALDAAVLNGHSEAVYPLIERIMISEAYRRKAVRKWTDWVCAGSAFLLSKAHIRQAVFSGETMSQARAAKTSNDLAWVRSHRADFMQFSTISRISIIDSMSILGKDERRAILNQIDETHGSPLDIAMKRYVT